MSVHKLSWITSRIGRNGILTFGIDFSVGKGRSYDAETQLFEKVAQKGSSSYIFSPTGKPILIFPFRESDSYILKEV